MRYAALLRGINVGGNRKVPMAQLREVLTDAGCEGVRTHIQSGNVVLDLDEPDESAAVTHLEAAIEAAMGFDVAVVLRTRAEWDAAIGANPFPAAEAAPTTLHVVFLAEPPPPDALDRLDLPRFAPDEARVVGREVYLHVPNGLGRSKLAAAMTDRTLRTVATARNWNTVQKLAVMLAE